MKNPRPGRAGLRHAPTTLVSGYRTSGPRNGSIDNPVPVVSVEINDPNDAGAHRRQACPGRPKGRKFKSRYPRIWYPSAADTKKSRIQQMRNFPNRQLPILPDRFQSSTFGV